VAAESADAVMGGASGRVGRPADELGNLRVRQAAHMVVGNRLPLLGWGRSSNGLFILINCVDDGTG
jgi:hypothetical protein